MSPKPLPHTDGRSSTTQIHLPTPSLLPTDWHSRARGCPGLADTGLWAHVSAGPAGQWNNAGHGATLHQPMFLLLATLAATDLGLATSIAPGLLAVLWLEPRPVPFAACLVQMFFVHALTAVESGVLLAMACDGAVAAGRPLHTLSWSPKLVWATQPWHWY